MNKTNIIEYKTRSKLFKNWINEVIKINNFSNNDNITSAIILWEEKNKNRESVIMAVNYHCNVERYEHYRTVLDDRILKIKTDLCIKDLLKDYLQL